MPLVSPAPSKNTGYKLPADAPKVGDVRYWNGEAFKILEVDWMNEVLVVRHDNDPPQCCGYYSFCNLVDS